MVQLKCLYNDDHKIKCLSQNVRYSKFSGVTKAASLKFLRLAPPHPTILDSPRYLMYTMMLGLSSDLETNKTLISQITLNNTLISKTTYIYKL